MTGLVEPRKGRLALCCSLAAILCGGALGGCTTGSNAAAPRFLGTAVIDPMPADSDDPVIGGLSSIFHVDADRYVLVSDDRGAWGPARYYSARIDLDDGRLDEGDVAIDGYTELRDADGEPLAPRTYDLEGLVATDRVLFAASEGDAEAGISPFVAAFGADGSLIERLPLPRGIAPSTDGSAGVRNNQAFESLTITPDGRFLFTATEAALLQDGPAATAAQGSRSRILRFDRSRGVFDAQYLYRVEPVHMAAPTAETLAVTGLVELVALSDDHLLSLERSFVAGGEPEHSIKLYEVCLGAADDISSVPSLAAVDRSGIRAARKHLVIDLADAGVGRLDNVEGFTFGPPLPSGERSLIFVSDNNFAPARQITQLLAFSVPAGTFAGCSVR